MIGKMVRDPRAGQNVFGATLARFVAKRRSRSRSRLSRLRKMPLLHKFANRKMIGAPDPVSLAIFGIDCVGPAAVRACASGVEVRVAAPDEATAAVFRAALAETARRRGTDRLIRIVVERNLVGAANRNGPPDEGYASADA
jgi:hypothetical protein